MSYYGSITDRIWIYVTEGNAQLTVYPKQDAYMQLAATIGGVTRADAWQSAHQYGLAADFVRKIDGQWSWDGDFSVVKSVAEKYGCVVPMSWDPGHVESLDWRDLKKHLVLL